MPIYEYECGKCGVFEHSQRISEAALSKCPRCRRKVRRLISNTSFQLKGTGWYATDYAKAGKKGAKDGDGKADAKGAPESASGSNGGSASKSESTSKADTTSGSSTPSTTAS
jgi:putative FmdB family regulatory protein